MEKFLNDYKGKTKLFLGDTDSFSILENNLTTKEISQNLLLSSLLYDVVLFPAAYAWQSEVMAEVIHRNQALIIAERAIPVVRNFSVTRDIKDYYDKREEETAKQKDLEIYKDPSLNSELVKKENRKEMQFAFGLDVYMHLEDISVKDAFISLYKNDIDDIFDDKSIYNIIQRINCNAEQRAVYRKILRENTDYENFSRSTVIDIVNSISFNKDIEHRLRNRISNLYLLANAVAADADFFSSVDNNPEIINYSNLEMHKKTLEAFGINACFFEQLTSLDVLRILHSADYTYFISYYRDLILEIQNKNFKISAGKIKLDLEKEIENQRKTDSFINVTNCIAAPGVGFFCSLLANYISGSSGKLLNYGIGLTGGIAAYAVILDKIKKSNYYISKVGYLNFKHYIVNELYKKETHTTIKNIIL